MDDRVELEARRIYGIVQRGREVPLPWSLMPESIKDIWRAEARVQLAKRSESPGEC